MDGDVRRWRFAHGRSSTLFHQAKEEPWGQGHTMVHADITSTRFSIYDGRKFSQKCFLDLSCKSHRRERGCNRWWYCRCPVDSDVDEWCVHHHLKWCRAGGTGRGTDAACMRRDDIIISVGVPEIHLFGSMPRGVCINEMIGPHRLVPSGYRNRWPFILLLVSGWCWWNVNSQNDTILLLDHSTEFWVLRVGRYKGQVS